MTTDELLAQVKASRNVGSFDPVRGRERDRLRPASIHDPQVRLLEALGGIDLTPSERHTLLWLLDWDSLDNIAAMIEKRSEVVAASQLARARLLEAPKLHDRVADVLGCDSDTLRPAFDRRERTCQRGGVATKSAPAGVGRTGAGA